MVGSLGSIPLLPITNSNVGPENVIFSKTSCIANKLPKQSFAVHLVLSSFVKQFNQGSAFAKKQVF